MMRARSGFSLVEILVAMTLTLAVFAITLPFVRAQSRALGENAGRLDAEQIARYAQRAVDKELRLAVTSGNQPMLVYAGPMGISFSANLLAPDTSDPTALAVEAGAQSTLTEGWRVANAAIIPKTTRTYPAINYTDATGGLSRVETISFFLHPDTISGRSDVYVLWRRVNARDSAQVVRGIHVPADSAFFSYWRVVSGSLTRMTGLPLFWDSTSVSQVRAVGIRSSGFFRNRVTGRDVIRTVQWRVNLPTVSTASGGCGAAPGAPSGVSRSKSSGSNPYSVTVDWNASADDNGGAYDVTHYVVRMRNESTGDTTIVASIPATRSGSYRFQHFNPSGIGSIKYGVRAVDCGGVASSTAEHNSSLTLP